MEHVGSDLQILRLDGSWNNATRFFKDSGILDAVVVVQNKRDKKEKDVRMLTAKRSEPCTNSDQ